MLLAGCRSGGSAQPETITVSDPDPRYVMDATLTDVDGTTKRVRLPVNQIVVVFERSVSSDAASGVLKRMVAEHADVGLKLVGQIPSLRIYQLEIDNPETDAQRAVARLDPVIAAVKAYGGVLSASYNSVFRFTIAENEDDNSSIHGTSRSAYSVIDYYQAVPIFDAIRTSLSFSPVVVGVLDSGIDLNTWHFSDIRDSGGGLEFVSDTAPTPYPFDASPERHGTAVCSIIAGNDRDGANDGVALRVLGDRLSLRVGSVLGAAGAVLLTKIVATAKVAVNRGATVVNMSIGDSTVRNILPSLTNARNAFQRLAEDTPGVLYIVSAPDDPGLVVQGNAAPAGLPVSNILTVGAIDSQDFTFWPGSSVSPGIELAAPGEVVPTCCRTPAPGHLLTEYVGNSFATPIVTSIAAIVKSLVPSMTGAELKAFLTHPNNTYPAPAEVGGRRPSLLRTVGNAILAHTSPSASVRRLLDYHNTAPIDGLADSPGLVINRLFGRADFTVSGPGYDRHHVIPPAAEGGFESSILSTTSSFITASGFTEFWLAQDSELVRVNLGSFHLGTPYALGSGGANTMLVVADSASGDRYVGAGQSGTVTLTECEITTRALPLDSFSMMHDSDPTNDELIAVEVVGAIAGAVADGTIASDPPQYHVRYGVVGTFTRMFGLTEPNAALLSYLEQHCIGGYQYAPP